ncbi:MAG TPA: hemerythrin domain-containing protein [Nitrospira sp.]
MSETRTISSFFQNDHDRLDALWQSFQALKRQNFSKAKETFTQFKSGLERHIRWEEDVLFPLWEDKTGMSDGGPTFVMRHEHRRLEEQLRAIDRNVTEDNADDSQPEEALLALLAAHNLKEERVLYPAIDRVTTPEVCRDILRTIQELPADRCESSAG